MAGAAAAGRRLSLADPWEEARAASAVAGVRLAPLRTVVDADEISRVMEATWGEHQLLPREMIVALAESGNVPWGAFEGAELIGYVLGWAGVDREGRHVHSHMLAVVPGRRSGGAGFALKLAQRAQAIEQGFDVIRWTYDPLLASNAWFNIGKLGAVADRFGKNFYGEMEDSLNTGERSDRFMIRWDLERTGGDRLTDGPALLMRDEGGSPILSGSEPEPGATVQIPKDYPRLKNDEPAVARAWREASAEVFEACIDAGLEARAFDKATATYKFGARAGSSEASRAGE